MIIRKAKEADLKKILNIYNQGIIDRVATLEVETKDQAYMEEWLKKHTGRFPAIVAEDQNGCVTGYASINQYNARYVYDGVGEISVYVKRGVRGTGIGQLLLKEIEMLAIKNGFHKLILFTFPFNDLGQGLYRKLHYKKVGIFKNQGKLDGEFVDVMIMEKLLTGEK